MTNKTLMRLLKTKLTMKSNRTPDEEGMLVAFAKPLDCTKRENIKEIVEYAHSLA